ncbi:MAG: hypothetical protein Q8Q38_01420 [bacterium]|nr:hypothetical protein [bacterium]
MHFFAACRPLQRFKGKLLFASLLLIATLFLSLYPVAAQAFGIGDIFKPLSCLIEGASTIVFGADCVGDAVEGIFSKTLGSTAQEVRNLISSIFGFIISLPIMFVLLPLFVVVGALAATSTFLGYVMVEFVKSTMSIGVIPGNQEIVQIGYAVSLNLANMILVLMFVIIGLATILRLQNYQMNKLLPTLVIIALLVNFSGVLVGFVVDIGNVVASFFLEKTVSIHTLADQAKGGLGDIQSLLFGGFENILPNTVSLIARLVVYFIYYLLLALVLFIVMFLFFARIIVLWILAMLAPLAFVAYVFPATKQFWGQWWKNLIQWSIIGVPISFFLYISSRVAEKMTNISGLFEFAPVTDINDITQAASTALTGIIISLIGPFVVLVMMAVGIGLSLTLAPAGAQGVINFGKKAGIGLGLAAGTGLWRRVGQPLEDRAKAIRGWAAQRQGLAAEKMGTGQLGFVRGYAQRGLFGAAKLAAAGYGLGLGQISSATRTKDDTEISKARSDGKNVAALDNINDMATELGKGRVANMNTVIGRMMAIGDNGDTDDLHDELKPGGKLQQDNMRRVYDAVKQRGTPYRRHMEKMFIDDVFDEVDENGKITEQNWLGVSAEHQNSIREKVLPQDVSSKLIDPRSLDPTTEKGARAFEALIETQGNTLMPAIARIPDRDVRLKIGSHIDAMDPEWFIKKNAEDVLVWSMSPAAQSIGIRGIGGLDTRAKVNAFINDHQLSGKSMADLEKSQEEHKVALAEVEERRRANPKGQLTRGDQGIKNSAEREITKIETELNIRSMSPDQLREAMEITKANLNRLTSSRRLGKADDTTFFARRKEYQESIRRFQSTLRKAEPQSLEDQPLTVQIADLEAQATALGPRAGGGVRARVSRETGVSIPGGGMLYQPGARARKSVKEIRTDIQKLRKEQENQSPALRTFENLILEDRTRIRAKGSTIGILEKGIANLSTNERQITAELQGLSSLPSSNQRVAEIRSGLQELQQRKQESEKTLAQLRESLGRDQQRVAEEIKAWKGIKESRSEVPQKTTTQIIEENLKAAEQDEALAMEAVAKLRVMKMSPEEILRARRRVDEIRQSRSRWEQEVSAARNQGGGTTTRRRPPNPPSGGTPPTAPPTPRRPQPGTGGGSGTATPPPSGSGGGSAASATPPPSSTAPSPPPQSSPPASSAALRPTQRRSGTPTWLIKGLTDLEGGKGVPSQTTQRLRQYLNARGITNDEIANMTPQQAWGRANDFSRE